MNLRFLPCLRFGFYLPVVAGLAALSPLLPAADAPRPVEPSFFDPKIKAADNFFQFTNAGWFQRAIIPGDRTQFGVDEEVQERNEIVLRELAEDCARTPGAAGGVRQKVGDFYSSGMDEATINAEGTKPLAPQFALIQKVTDAHSLATTVGTLHAQGLGALFDVSGELDEKDSRAQIAWLAQGGLGLPSNEYYLKDDAKSKEFRTQYERHVAIMFLLHGSTPAEAAAAAATVLRVETVLAKSSKTPVDLRDPEENYHRVLFVGLEKLSPGFDWKAYFEALGVREPGPVDVCQTEFFINLGKIATEIPASDWKSYLTWQVLHGTAPALSTEFVNEDFRFFGTALRGVKELKPRWKRVLDGVDGAIGEALGQIYVEKYFPPAAKQRVLAMVEDIKAALKARLEQIDWMGPETRASAVKKLAAITVKIGYPEKWRDYSTLTMTRRAHVLNVMAGRAFELRRRLARIGQPVDRTEWEMSPPTINAYYSPNRNEIVFPAGILQTPYFDPQADDASNYGSIGAVIGHEITHGFDDQGRQYDAAGNLKNWWTDDDLKRFEERSGKIVSQFDAYEIEPGVHVNGKLTAGENIADLGGVKIAYAAWQRALARLPARDREKKVDGLTPEQRFFVAYSQSWREKTRLEALRLMVKTNPHSPVEFRVNGPLSNLPEFARAFGLPAGSPMARKDGERIDIW